MSLEIVSDDDQAFSDRRQTKVKRKKGGPEATLSLTPNRIGKLVDVEPQTGAELVAVLIADGDPRLRAVDVHHEVSAAEIQITVADIERGDFRHLIAEAGHGGCREADRIGFSCERLVVVRGRTTARIFQSA